MKTATLQREGVRPVLRFERHLAKPPAEVWHAITDRHELDAWFPHDVEGEWKVGAELTFTDRESRMDPMSGSVLEVDEPHVLSYTWGPEALRFELTGRARQGPRGA